MDIIVSYDSSVTASNFSGGATEEAQFKAAINYVVGMFDQLFTNPVSFTIDVGWGEDGGQSIPSYALAANTPTYSTINYNYAQVKQALENNSSDSAVQNEAYSFLPSADPTAGGFFNLTGAEAAALGLQSNSSATVLDEIGFGTGNWDFSTTTGPSPTQPASGQNDFIAAFEHELTEGMGRVSLAGGASGINAPLDLFRYSAPGAVDPAAVPQGTSNTAYLSFDGGSNSDGIFNNDTKWSPNSAGPFNPYDLGDWTQIKTNDDVYGGGTGPNGADAFGSGFTGVLEPFTFDDLEEMNVLGWNLSVGDDYVPEGITDYVGSGLANEIVVQSGAYLDVSASGITHSATLETGAFEDVFGFDSGALIYAGDFQYGDQIGQGQRVDSGGLAAYATIDGGEQEIEAGGSATDTTLNGGLQKVFGSATATDINFGAAQWVVGSDSGSTVENGGVQNIYANGTDKNSTIDAYGQQDDNVGGSTYDEAVSGQQSVYGTAYGSTIRSGGQQIIEAGGVAYNTYVESGGSLSIYGGVDALEVLSDGSATVLDGGSLQDWKGSADDDLEETVLGTLTFEISALYAYSGTLKGDGVVWLTAPAAGDSGGWLIVSDAKEFTGSYVIAAGRLEFDSAAAIGSGAIDFAPGASGTFQIDGADMPKNTIEGFAIGDTIDLAGVTYSASGSATLESGNVLQISENGENYDLQLDPSERFSDETFMLALASDRDGGVNISLSKVLITPVWVPPVVLDADKSIDIVVEASTTIADSTTPATFENAGLYRSVTVNSALTVENGGLTTADDFINSYDVDVDTSGDGGSVLTFGGTLFNNDLLRIGSSSLSLPTSVTAASLSNAAGGGTTETGQINLIGSKTAMAELSVNSPAGSGSLGVLTGNFDIEGEARLHFASGQIHTITNELLLNGVEAFISTGADDDHNSALGGLSTIGVGADLDSENGASAVLDGDLINEGFIYEDNSGDGGEHGDGGGMLSIGGVLTNEDQVYIGNANLTHPDEITANGVDNESTIGVAGASSSATGTLSVTGIFQNSGNLTIDPYAEVKVSRNYHQTGDGALAIYGDSAGAFGVMSVTGALTLDGGGAEGAFGSSLQVNDFTEAAGTSVTVCTFAPGRLTGMFGGLGNTSGTYANLGNGTYGGLLYESSLGKIVFDVVAAPTTTTDTWTAGMSGAWTASDWSNGAPTFYSDVTLGASAVVTMSVDTTLDSLTLDSGASLTEQSGHSLSIGQGLAVAATATLTVDGEMTVGESGTGALSGNVVVNGLLDFRSIASGGGSPAPNGTFTINSGGALELERKDYNNVTFSGSGGVLMLEDPGQFFGTISGLENGDTLDVAGHVTSATYNATEHALVLVDNGSTVDIAVNPTETLSNVGLLLGSGGDDSTTIMSAVLWTGVAAEQGGLNIWNDSGNWAPNIIPGATNAVLIGPGFNVASDDSNAAGDLTLGDDASLTIDDNTTLAVEDTLDSAGTIQFAGSGTLTLGSGDDTLGMILTAGSDRSAATGDDTIEINGNVETGSLDEIILSNPLDAITGADNLLANILPNPFDDFPGAFSGPQSTLTVDDLIEGVGVVGMVGGSSSDDDELMLDIGATGGVLAIGSGSDTIVRTLVLDPTGQITNQGLLEASDDGTLSIRSNVVNQGANAVLNALSGTIDIDGITVYGGMLESGHQDLFYYYITADDSILDGSTYGSLTNTAIIELNSSGASLTLKGTIINDGAIFLSRTAEGADESLVIDGAVTLGVDNGFTPGLPSLSSSLASGAVVLQTDGDQVGAESATDTLDLGGYIVGVGTIDLPAQITIAAGGAIWADGDYDLSAKPDGILTIDTYEPIANSGTLGAVGDDSSTLVINNSVDNTGNGEILAKALGSGVEVVEIHFDTIDGGTLATTANGSIVANGATLDGVAVDGAVNVDESNDDLTLTGAIGISTDGTISLTSASDSLIIEANVTLSGPGRIDLSGADDQIESLGTYTKANNLPASLLLDSEIEGEGTIGDPQLTLTVGSTGQIVANGAKVLSLHTGSNTILNSGRLESDGGHLLIDSDVDNAGGTIFDNVAHLDDLVIAGVTISGGAMAGTGTISLNSGAIAGSGQISLGNGAVLDGSSDGELTNETTLLIILASTTVSLEGAINNAGSIVFDDQLQTLQLNGNVALSGGGQVFLVDSTDKIVSNGKVSSLTSSNEIIGVGTVGDANTTLTISSGGSIVADPTNDLTASSGNTLTIATLADTIVNHGLLGAQNGGVLQVSNNINNASGMIRANGAKVDLNGISVAGGTLSTPTGGVIDAFDDVTLDGESQGDLENAATVDVESKGATLTLAGAIVNTGILDLATLDQVIKLSGDVTLTGVGKVILGDVSDSLVDNGSPTTFSVGNEIAGVGAIGDSAMSLTIAAGGSIIATPLDDNTATSGSVLMFAPLAGGSLVNNGELSVEAGGALVVKDSVTGTGDATIGAGTLELGGAFSQNINFTTGDKGLLQIENVSNNFGSEILGFTTGDVINLANVTYDPKGGATLEAGNLLDVVENGTTYEFKLDPSQDFGSDTFALSQDKTAGTDITVDAVPIVTHYHIPQSADAINPEVGNLGDLIVGSASQATDASVNSGGEVDVQSGGVAMGGSINDGGVEYVEAGGSAQGVLLNDPGAQIVEAGGSSTDTTVSGGDQDVYGSAYSTDVETGGLQIVEAGGTAYGAEAETGGEQDVDGGADQGVNVDGGLVKFNDGGALKGTAAISAGTVLLNDAAVDGQFYFAAGAGAVEISAGAEISGEIDLGGDDATLRVDGALMPNALISGFGVGAEGLGFGEDGSNNDVIDLANIAYDPDGSAALLANNVLQIVEHGKTYDLNLDQTLSYTGFGFALAADATGTGTAIKVGLANDWTNNAGGDWTAAANWSDGTPTSNQGLTSDAVIALPKVTATIAAGESETVGSLALADDAVLDVDGALTIKLALSISGGAALYLDSGASLSAASLDLAPGGELVIDGGSLSTVNFFDAGVIDFANLGAYRAAPPGAAEPSSFTITVSGDVVTQTNADGSKQITTYGISGQAFKTRLLSYAANGQIVAKYYEGVNGEGDLTSSEYLYAGENLVGTDIFYTGITNEPYTAEEIDYDGLARVIRAAFTGVNGEPYSSYEYDYVGGVYLGSKFTYTAVPSGASYSSYEVDYSQTGALVGDKFFFSEVTGEGYTGAEMDFDANSALGRVLLTGVESEAYSSLELDYSAGTYVGCKAYYTVAGQSYSDEEVDVSASGQLEKVVYSGIAGKPYQTVEQDFSGGSLNEVVFGYTDVTGQTYNAYQVTEDAKGNGLRETFDLNSGGHAQIALIAGQTLTSLGNDKFVGSGATTFVLDAIYGADTFTNFNSADTVSLSSQEYSHLSSAIGSGNYTGGNAMLTFSDGDTLTFKNMTEAGLSALATHFTTHA